MRTLWLKPLRDLKRMKIRATTVSLMVAFGVAIYAGMYMSRASLFHTRNTFYTDLHLSDLRVIITPSDPSELPPLESIPGLARYAKRLVTPGSIEMGDGRTLNSVIIYRDPAQHAGVNELQVLEGHSLDLQNKRDVVVERSLAEVHGYQVGDSMILNPYTTPVDVKVIGIGISPEWLIATVDSTIFFPIKGSLGVIHASMDLVRDLFGYPLYNELSFLFEEGVNKKEVEARILKSLRPLGIERVIRRKEEFTYRFLEESLRGFSAFLPSLAFVFVLVIFLVTSITSHRLLTSQRMEIGVLRSLGYRRSEITVSYFFLAGLLCFFGGVVGAALSHWINVLFAGRYADALGLPRILPVFVPSDVLEGWLMASAVVLFAFFLPLHRLMRDTPRQIIRHNTKKVFTGLPSCLSYWGTRLSSLLRLGIFVRFAVRNLYRRVGLTAATILSVSLSVALGSSLMIVLRSVEAYKDRMLDREAWEVMVNFRYALSFETMKEVLQGTGVARLSPGVTGFAQILSQGEPLDVQITGFPADRFFRSLNLVKGRMFLSDDERGLILNENWIDKDKPGFHIGQKIPVRADGRETVLTVTGIMNDMTVGQAYVPIGTAQFLFNSQDKINGVMATLAKPLKEVKRALYGHEEVGDVFSRKEIEEGVQAYLLQIRDILHTAVMISILIATLFLLGSVFLTILEREMEYATLRAMGYNRARISRIVWNELMLETGIAVVASIPLAMLLAFFINDQQGKIYFHIPTVVDVPQLSFVSVLAFVIISLAALPGLFHIFRLKISDVVRESQIG